LVVAAYENQLDIIFNLMGNMIYDAPKIKDSIKNVRKKPHEIWFENGSSIIGNVGNSSVRGKCLPAGTKVWMAGGSWKSVEEIKAGERVRSYDLDDLCMVTRKVTAIHDNGKKLIYQLNTTSSRILKATAEHKIFIFGKGFIELEDIKTWKTDQNMSHFVGVVDINGGLNWSRAYNVEEMGEERTYDLTVEEEHNFIVMTPPPEELGGFRISGVANGGFLVHNSAHDLIIDEGDYIPENIIIEDIWPISTSHKDTQVIFSSTPSGRRGFFFNLSRNKDDPRFDFHEHHIPSSSSPEWTTEQEALARSIADESQYNREYCALFSDATEGVFRNKFIEPALFVYDYPDLQFNPENYYTMGVDWNEAATGVHVVILEHVNKPVEMVPYRSGLIGEPKKVGKVLRLFKADRVDALEYTNVVAVDFILSLLHKYRIDYACFDHGHGHTNWELLRLSIQRGISPTGMRCTGLTRMLDRMEVVDFGGSSEVIDPTTNSTSKVRTKNFLVRNGVRVLEGGRIIIPAVDVLGNPIELNEKRLVGQMRAYTVERVGARGEVYSKGNDHVLDSWMLAVHAYLTNHDDFMAWDYAMESAGVEDSTLIPHAIARRNVLSPVSSKKTSLDPEVFQAGEYTVNHYGHWPKKGEPPEREDKGDPLLPKRRGSRGDRHHTPRRTDI